MWHRGPIIDTSLQRLITHLLARVEHGRLVVLHGSILGILERACQTANIVHLLGCVAALTSLLFIGLHRYELVLSLVGVVTSVHVVLLLLLIVLTRIVAHGASRTDS